MCEARVKFFKKLLVIPAATATLLANPGFADVSAELSKSNQAKEDSQTLKITVSGTKTPRRVEDLPATVSVFNDVQEEQGSDIRDLLKYETGVSTKNNIFHGLQDINIRGMEGNRVLIEHDGVRVPTLYTFGPYNVGRGQYIDSSSINNLEVLRGPASSLYGSDALGGVVSFRSLKASDLLEEGETRKFEFPLVFDGSNNGRTGTIRWAEDAGRANLLFSYTTEKSSESDTKASAEYTNDQENEGQILYGNFGYDFDDNKSISLSVENLYRESETTEASGNLGIVSGRNQTKYVYDNDVEKSKLVLKYEQENINNSDLFDGVTAKIYHQNSEADDNRYEYGTRPSGITNYFREDIYEFNEKVTGFDFQLVKNTEISKANHRLSYGGSFSNTKNERPRSKFETDLDTGVRTAGVASTPTLDFPDSDTKRLGIFLQDEITFGNNFELIAGLRYDSYDLEPEASSLFPSQSSSFDSTALSPKIALIYNIDDETSIYGQYSRGFRPPNYNEINNGFTNIAGRFFKYETLPNPDLEAETSNSYEIGIKKSSPKWDVNLSAYYNKYEDFISSFPESTGSRCLTSVPGCPPSFTRGFSTNSVTQFKYTNTSKATIYGIELGGEYRLPEATGLSFIYSAALSQGDDDTKDVPLASVNPFKLVTGLKYLSTNKKWSSELTATHTGKARVSSTSTTYVPKAQTVLDLTNKYKFNEKFDVNLGIYNLIDAKYFEYSDVRSVSASSPADFIDSYSQPGRNVKAGFKFSF